MHCAACSKPLTEPGTTCRLTQVYVALHLALMQGHSVDASASSKMHGPNSKQPPCLFGGARRCDDELHVGGPSLRDLDASALLSATWPAVAAAAAGRRRGRG